MNRAFKASYLINMVVQGFWCLLLPIGIALGLGWLMVNKLSWPSWVMVPPLIFAVFMGLFSMCKFLISATTAMDRMEAQREADREAVRRAYAERQQLKKDISLGKSDSAKTEFHNDENDGGEKIDRK